MCSTTTTGAMEPTQRKVEESSSDDEQQQNSQHAQSQQSQMLGVNSRDIELAVPLIDKKSGHDNNNKIDNDGTPALNGDSDKTTETTDGCSVEWFVRNTKKNAKVLSACSFYSFCSVSMVLVNKSLASRYVLLFLLLYLFCCCFVLHCCCSVCRRRIIMNLIVQNLTNLIILYIFSSS